MQKLFFQPFQKIILRTPLNSIADVNNCYDKSLYELQFHQFDLFSEGIYLSSPDFFSELSKVVSIDNNNSNKKRLKLYQTFCRYWNRSCIRSTPFGTFAGCTVLHLNSATSIELGPASYLKQVRLDMGVFSEIVAWLNQQPQIKSSIQYYSNDSLYETFDSYRYANYSFKNRERFYTLTSVDKTDYLGVILDLAKNGASLSDLRSALINDNVTIEEAEEYLNTLIDAQILVSSLEPCITGDLPLKILTEKIAALDCVHDIVDCLKAVQRMLYLPQSNIEYYSQIKHELSNKLFNVKDHKNIFQVDLYQAGEKKTISVDLINEIVSQTENLFAFSRPYYAPALEKFRENFTEKFEAEPIPIALALDTEFGVGYNTIDELSTGNSPFINGLNVNYPSTSSLQYDNLSKFILKKYSDYVINESDEIQINDNEIEQLKTQNQPYKYPTSCCIIGNLAQQDTLDNFVFKLNTCTGPSAANFIARFAHGNSDIRNLVQEIVDNEEATNPDVIFCEIVHLPETRVGNILLRPCFRKYEIPYLGTSQVDKEYQIPIDDIYVQVINDLVYLWSKKLKKLIIPRLTTAHNFQHNSLPIYQFLCDLQFQHYNATINWDWGPLLEFSFLPKVRYKNIILQPARWLLKLDEIFNLPENEGAYIEYFQKFRKTRKIPDIVLCIEDDNEILINFNKHDSIVNLINSLKKWGILILREFLFESYNSAVQCNGKPYANELIIPVFNTNKVKYAVPEYPFCDTSVQRKFLPNSEWLHIKLYCSSRQADRILREAIYPFIYNHPSKLFDKFFFVRYFDTQSHLRLRFYNLNKERNQLIQKEIINYLQPLVYCRVIHKIDIDSYIRELERYDVFPIEWTESFFYNDSLAILQFLTSINDDDDFYHRILFALRGIDALFNDFNLSIHQKVLLVKTMQFSFFNEFGGTHTLTKQLNDRYRLYQKDIYHYMNTATKDHDVHIITEILKERTVQNKIILNNIDIKLVNYYDFKFLMDYIHMFMNRLFVSNNRKYELVIYHFYERYISSQLAIESTQSNY